MTDNPPVEPITDTVIRAFYPAVSELESKQFTLGVVAQAHKGLIRKINLEAHAARTLAENVGEIQQAPHSPVMVLSRSIVESAGLYARWFLNGMPSDQRDFEIMAATLAGEIGRLKHVLNTPIAKKKQEETQKDADYLAQKLEQMPYWNTLSSGQQNQVTRGKWKAVDKSLLAAELGYGENTLSGLYGWLSDASHGGMRILLQLASDTTDGRRLTRASMNYIGNAIGMLLYRLSDTPEVSRFLRENNEVRDAIGIHFDLTKD